jgi:integrase/recombinase XerC
MAGSSIAALGYAYVTARVNTGRITAVTAATERLVLAGFADVITVHTPARLKRDHIEQWLTSIRHLAPGTRRNRFGIVRRYCRWLVERGTIRHDPTIGIPAPKVPRSVHRTLGAEQIHSILAVCPDARARCIVILGVQLGLRRAEIAGLEVGDVDWGSRTVAVIGKGGHKRVVPLTSEADAAIRAYLASSPTVAGPLIRSDRKPYDHVRPQWVGETFARLAWRSRVKTRPHDGVGTHSLRHTAASDVYAACRDVLVVRDLLGHVSLATTQVYVRGLDLEPLRAAIEGRSYAA